MQAGASRILLRRQASRQVARHCTPSGLSGCRATPIRRSSAVSTHRGSPSPIPRCSPAAAPWHRQQTARYSSTPSTFGSINSPRNSSPEAYPSSSDSDAASPSPSSSAAETDASSSVHHDDDAASSSSSSISREEQEQGDPFSAAAEEELLNAPSPSRQPLGKIERRLSITFTCTVPNCGHRSTHEFSRHAYEKGIVLVQCPGCSSRHLIGKLSAGTRFLQACRPTLRCEKTEVGRPSHLHYTPFAALLVLSLTSGPSRMVQQRRPYSRWQIQDHRGTPGGQRRTGSESLRPARWHCRSGCPGRRGGGTGVAGEGGEGKRQGGGHGAPLRAASKNGCATRY